MMYEAIIISGMWAIVTAVILKDILAVKRAEAKVKIAEAERMMAQRDYYRDLMRRKRKQEKENEGSSGSIEGILEELGIDLNNPLVRKMIEKYAKKFFEKLGSEGSEEEEKIKFVG